MVGAVRLVHDKDDVGVGSAQELGCFLVDRVNASAGIDDKDDEVRGVHRDAGLESDLIGKAVLIESADAAGIDDFAGVFGESAGCGDAVPGDAGHIVHDGDAPSGQTIEEGGFPDVGTSDDGNLEWTCGHGCLLLRAGIPKEQGLDEDGDAVDLDGAGGRSLEIVEDELVPLVAGGFGEIGLNVLFTIGADHHGEGVHDQVIAESHAGDRVILDVTERSGAGGAFPGPFLMIGAFCEFVAALGNVWVFFEEGGHFVP